MNFLQAHTRMHFASMVILSMLFVAAGTNHFVNPDVYVKIMPAYLSWKLALVYISGLFEILGALGLAIPRIRFVAEWGLIALLFAVFPANVHMVIHADRFASIPLWVLVARLPFQGILIAWVWWAAIKGHDDTRSGNPV